MSEEQELKLETELGLKKVVVSILKNGRQNWDLPHALCVVGWMKKIILHEGGNARILVPAAYLHDIGYCLSGFKGGSYNETKNAKEQHAIQGAKKAPEILKEIGTFSDDEIKEITHLVSIHDTLDKLSTYNEFRLFEADSLGMIDHKRVPPTYDKKNLHQFLYEEYIPKRFPLFKSQFAKTQVKELLSKAKNNLEAMD